MRQGSALAVRLGLALILSSTELAAQVTISGKVVDDTGVAVAGARVNVENTAATSDTGGNFALRLEKPGEYRIRAERPGFFLFSGKSTFSAGLNQLVITLNHLQEFAESVDVTYSPPVIDLQEPDEHKQLNNVEILTVPYPAPQDLRNALPLLNGVVQDVNGRPHFNGGSSEQTNFMLDGFNISDPVTGRLDTRLNIETVQSLDVDTSRFAAEKGRGSSGSLDIRTKMGDDHWRFGTTNFIPSLSTQNGLHFNKWTPRVEFSGPLSKGRAWFHNGFDAFYDVDIVPDLPRGQNRMRGLTTSNLSRFQVNVTPANIVTGSFLVNHSDRTNYGLSFLDPLETTTDRLQALYMYTLKDQVYFHNGALAEFGYAGSRMLDESTPRGNQIYEISPAGRRGNYFVDQNRHSYRQEWLANLFFPTVRASGTHQFKFGMDLERDSFHQQVTRHDYRVLREDQSLARYVTFAGAGFLERRNIEVSQYFQDRWTPRDGLLVEAGLRTDWDQALRDVAWSPRVSLAWAPKALRDTKIAAGFGVFHDALILGTISQNQDQVSYSTFYLPGGQVRGPLQTAFLVDERGLRLPDYRAWSASLERKLPVDFYGKAAFTHKTGGHGFVFASDTQDFGGFYHLRNTRRDRYDALELSVRRTFAGQFEWSAGYTRSSTRTSAVVDYSLENPIFGPQAPGPFGWDTPNRFLTWGWAPLPKRLLPRWLSFVTRETSVVYLVEYRTGFPFSVVNDEGLLVGPPNGRRFPSYFNINLHFEHKFRFFHYLWAWRFGFNNITNSGNPNVVNNNIDSPSFLAYGRGQVRAFSVRLRLLGKR